MSVASGRSENIPHRARRRQRYQVIIVLISGSTALLADTIHNFGRCGDVDSALDRLLPYAPWSRPPVHLWFRACRGRRGGDHRRADLLLRLRRRLRVDRKIIHPQPITNLGWVAAAAIIGFIGNEAVAIFRIRVGKEIGSAALIADGQHSRVDGFTSLAVLVGALGVWLGYRSSTR